MGVVSFPVMLRVLGVRGLRLAASQDSLAVVTDRVRGCRLVAEGVDDESGGGAKACGSLG